MDYAQYSYLMQTGEEARGETGKAKAFLNGCQAALEVCTVEELRQL